MKKIKSPCNCQGQGDFDLQTFTAVAELIDVTAKKLFRIYNRYIGELGMTPQQYHLLKYLWEYDGVPLKTLAQIHATAKSTITGIVDNLEKNGFVVRERDSKDRRVILVRLTDKGHDIRRRNSQIHQISQTCCSGLSSHELRLLKKLLLKFDQQVSLPGQRDS